MVGKLPQRFADLQLRHDVARAALTGILPTTGFCEQVRSLEQQMMKRPLLAIE